MERKSSIDLLRIISAFAIVIIHVMTDAINNAPVTASDGLKNVTTIIHLLMQWAVPIFFMITGYCLTMKRECTYKYCFSHVIKYVMVLFTIGLFYALLEEVFVARTFNFQIIFNSVKNIITGNLWDHMWFVYSIIGIYLVMPVIHKFMQQSDKEVYTLLAILFIFTIVFETIENYFKIGFSIPFGGYLFYVVFGGAVAKGLLKDKKPIRYISYLLAIISVVWIIAVPDKHGLGYRHITVCMMAIALFFLLERLQLKPSKFMLTVSSCTWGIYLIHPLFINAAVKFFKIDLVSSMPYLKLGIFAVILFILSFIVIFVAKKIPGIKKLF